MQDLKNKNGGRLRGARILCLMAYGRPGSSLFHTLLDGHPQIVCFPRTFQFGTFWQKGVRNGYGLDEMADSFINSHPRFFSGTEWYRFNKHDRADQLGPGRDETFSVDRQEFRKNLLEEMSGEEFSRTSFFLALHSAYHRSCHKVFPADPVILYHLHAIELRSDLEACLEDFPGLTYLVVMTRHPLEMLNSCLNVMKMRNTLSCGEVFFQQKRILKDISHIVGLFGDDGRIRHLPFDHIHKFHRKAMESFTKWMGMEWSDSLMVSTIHGKIWWGNARSMTHGTNPGKKIYQPLGFLEKKDWTLFANLLRKRMKRFGYVASGDCRRVGRCALLAIAFLPTAMEWKTLVAIFSVSHWMEVVRRLSEDERDSRLKTAGFRREAMKHILIFNPIKWVYYYIARVAYFCRFLLINAGDKERIPPLFIEGVLFVENAGKR